MAIDRRHFMMGAAAGAASFAPRWGWADGSGDDAAPSASSHKLGADLVIIGGGLGGCAAALAALSHGLRVVMTEPTDWIGGQLTAQAVPPDEHRWIESHGANRRYRQLRTQIRDYYRRHYPLIEAAREKPNLDPGNGSVSRLCHEPRVALAVLRNQLAPYQSGGKLTLLTEVEPVAADVDGDRVRHVTVRSQRTGARIGLTAPYFIDATELGDLLPLTGTEYVTGAESKEQTGELHAADVADPDNQQAFTMCFAVDYRPGENHVIDRPGRYEFWKNFVPELTPPWPGRLLDFTYTHPRSGEPKTLGFDPTGAATPGTLNLWLYRRIADTSQFAQNTYDGDISLINWPQNDYLLGNLVDVTDQQREQHIAEAKQLALSLLYWLQNDAPRADGGQGYPGLRLRRDLVGTEDGLAKHPYARESRRIRALTTVTEAHVGRQQRAMETGKSGDELSAASFADSVGVGSYAIDLHPSTGGDNYIDFPALPFQVPLGALIPQRMRNLIAGCKNIGTTHVTGGCYRLHPVEWGIGEAAGALIAFAQQKKQPPHAVQEDAALLNDFQKMLRADGVETEWP